MRLQFATLVLLSAAVAGFVGCGKKLVPPVEQQQAEGGVGADVDGNPAGRQFVRRDADAQAGETPDDAEKSAQNPLIRGVQEFLKSSEVIEDKGGLEDSLLEADSILTRVKRENQDALRNLNRQQRLPGVTSPNIVLIVADALGIGDLGCYGQKRIRTPQIDALAGAGMRFTDFYAGSPNQQAARWCLMTGLNSGAPSMPKGPVYPLRTVDVTLANVLWRAGYTTAYLGGWGSAIDEKPTHPLNHGYDEFFGHLSRSEANVPFPERFVANNAEVKLLANSGGKRGQYGWDFVTREAATYLNRHREGRPFFLQLEYEIVGASSGVPDAGPYADEEWPQSHKNYAAAITRFDGYVGDILARLKDLQMERNTVVIVTAESAPSPEMAAVEFFASCGPFHSNGTGGDLHEGRLRIPLIVRWPARVRAGGESRHICAAWDLLPTLADVVSALHRPRGIDGITFLPTLLGQSQQVHKLLYWESHADGFAQAVRLGRWKGIRPAGSNELELYDLTGDAAETNDVAAERPEIVTKMIRQPVASNAGQVD